MSAGNIPTTDAGAFLTTLYTVFQQTTPSPDQISNWEAAAQSGTRCAEIAKTFALSSQFANRVYASDLNRMADLQKGLFGRIPPSMANADSWLDVYYRNGLATVVDSYLTSDSFTSRCQLAGFN